MFNDSQPNTPLLLRTNTVFCPFTAGLLFSLNNNIFNSISKNIQGKIKGMHNLLLSQVFLCLKLKISVTAKQIDFSIIEKLYIGSSMVLGYFYF